MYSVWVGVVEEGECVWRDNRQAVMYRIVRMYGLGMYCMHVQYVCLFMCM